jgi:Domain of unknown function (DUF1338)
VALLDDLLDTLWTDYVAIVPQAARIHRMLRDRGETVRNDHISLRTIDLPEVEIEALDRAFVAEGYEAARSYQFPDRNLIAYHYEHRDGDRRPKLFISALLVDELPPAAQAVIRGLIAQVEPGAAAHPSFAASGRHWQLSSSDHETLRRESEHAAWVAAFGFRASSFAIDVAGLRTFEGLPDLNRFLKENGVTLDAAGGEIKGSPAELLEHSRTASDEVEVALADGPVRVRSGTYDFIHRHVAADGTLFRGFAPER